MPQEERDDQPVDGLVREAEPSTLFLFWNDEQAPLEEEVRLAGASGLRGLAFPDETLEPDETLRWALLARQEETALDFVLWAEDRHGPYDDQLAQALSQPELSLAQRCRFWVGIECWLDRKTAARGFQLQLQLAQAIALPGLLAVYDENSGRVFSAKEVRDLAQCSAPPRSRHLFSVQRLSVPGGLWLHTYGLSRAGLPELDLIGIPGDALAAGHELIEVVADALFDGRSPDRQGMIELGEGLRVRALSPEGADGVIADELLDAIEDQDTDGHRLILLDALRAVPPLRLLTRGSSQAARALVKSVGETRRMRSLALARFGVFGQLFTQHQGDPDWRFEAKLAYSRRHAPDVREHLWFHVLGLKPGLIHGRLLSRPTEAIGLDPGHQGWQSLDRLTDWLVHTPEGSFDPERAPALLEEPH